MSKLTLTGKLAIVFSVLLAVTIIDTVVIHAFQAAQRTDAAVVDAAGRDRMLSQRIGLFAEQVIQGHDEVRSRLAEAIELHDRSFLALRDGGVAPGIANGRPLPAASQKIRPLADRAGELWLEYKRQAGIVASEPRTASDTPSQASLDALEFVEANASEMLQRNDDLTKAFVAANEDKQRILNLVLLVILLINALAISAGFAVSRSLVRALQAIDKAKTEFVSLASHQLLTPITSIRWTTEMLLNDDFGKLTPDQRVAAEDIAHVNRKMKDLVNSFLNLSRIELGVFIIEPESLDLASLCEDVLAELQPRIRKKKQVIVREFEPDLPPMAADPGLMRIIFQNYLSNSVKYAPAKGRITVALKRTDREFVLSVGNDGPGIPPKDQPKIFSKMFRADNAREMDPDGNGLGLYLVKEIVGHAGGRVWFESETDKQTVFYAAFPHSGMKRKRGTRSLSKSDF